ncbi:hypothetical protein [Dactylosporangium sp. NPDC048998]|uniref:hypothetical protein n=1 Tax=Dactylosporangium sp. NPDC048998 TaxID=3363976 RepID=UPI00371EA4C4
MLRTRLALVTGSALLVLSCLVGCWLPAILEPQPPWHDPTAQQAEWEHLLTWLIGSALALLIGAWLLLAYGWTRWRVKRRQTRATINRPAD